MNKDVQNKWLSKERLAIVGASAVFVLFNWILWDPKLFNFIFNDSEVRSEDSQKVGDIVEMTHDTRLKSQRSMNWRPVDKAEAIYSGDSVFTGEKSNVSVTMNDGGRMDLGENTLVFFKNVKGIQIPTLAQGKFKISVEGKMKVSINNQITEVDGKNSQIEMVIKKGRKPQVKLLKGTAEIKLSKKQAPILLSKISSPEISLPIAAPPPKTKEKVSKPLLNASATPIDNLEDFDVPELPEDIQVKTAAEAIAHPEPVETFVPEETPAPLPPPRAVAIATPVPTPQPTPEPTPLLESQISQVLHAFAGPAAYDYNQRLYDIYDVNGANVSEKSSHGYSVSLPVKVGWEIQGALEQSQGPISVEYSQSPNFVNSQKIVNPANPLTLSSVHEGANYWRLTLNDRPSLQSNSFYINAKPLGFKPKLAFQKNRLLLETTSVDAVAQVSTPESESGYIVQSSVKPNFSGESKITWSSSADVKLRLNVPGAYYIRVRAVNQKTELSQFSEVSQIFVERPLPPRLAKAAPTPAPLPRKIASEAPAVSQPLMADATPKIIEEIPKDDYVIPNYLNRNYSSSRFNFEINSFNLYSAEQLESATGGAATGTSVTVGVRNWLNSGNNGYDLSWQNTLASNGLAKPMLIDAAYLHRWFTRWNPFSSFNQSQIAWLLGIEYYKNSGEGVFSQSYNLVRSGFLFDFPLLQNWSTGGEIDLGYGLDQSQKYELNGFVNYIFHSKWSLGGGYRLNLFQAGTQSAPPKTATPYREAYGEFYSTLQFHY